MMSAVMSASASDRTKTSPSAVINHIMTFVENDLGSQLQENISNGGTGSQVHEAGTNNERANFLINFTTSHTAGGGRSSTNIGYVLGKPPDSAGTKGTNWLTDNFPEGAVLVATTHLQYPGISSPLLHPGSFEPTGMFDGIPDSNFTINFDEAQFNLGDPAADAMLIPGRMFFSREASSDPSAFNTATGGTGIFEPEFKILEDSLIVFNANTGKYSLFPSDDFNFKLRLRIQ